MKNKKGFTMLEMILVLTVISIIILITIPNIAKKRQLINEVGCKALIEVVNGQILVYQLDGSIVENIYDLVNSGLINESQTVCPTGQKIVINNGQAVTE